MERTYDVLVVGGGTAGLVAAVSSARLGARTLLIEQKESFGGLAAVGMSIGGFRDKDGKLVISGIPEELTGRVVALGGGLGTIEARAEDRWIHSMISLDPESLKQTAFEMLDEAGCKFFLHTVLSDVSVENNRIESVEALFCGQKMRLRAHNLIDATGNADVAAMAGAEVLCGDEQGHHQSLTSIFRISNVRVAAFVEYMNKVLNGKGEKDEWNIESAAARHAGRYWLPWRDFTDHRLPNACGIYVHGNEGDVFINATHAEADPLDPEQFSRVAVDLRQQAGIIHKFFKKNIPGFSKSYLANIYDVGVRESRRIVGDHILSVGELTSCRHFEDVVAKGAYPPDVHKSFGDVKIDRNNNVGYEIPYSSLIAKDLENLLAAGRCISGDFMAAAGFRGMGPCMSTGQAAGTAAALAASKGIPLRGIEITVLQKKLSEQGVIL